MRRGCRRRRVPVVSRLIRKTHSALPALRRSEDMLGINSMAHKPTKITRA
jgi:hypothetical protein